VRILDKSEVTEETQEVNRDESCGKELRVLICGDRNWHNIAIIERELKKFGKDTIVIEGESRGADILGRFVAEKLGLQIIPFPAKWHIYKRGGGPVRNQQMLDEGNPELVLAFHEDISQSIGTIDMVNRARRAGVKVIIIKR
jgi:hypothetical protein